MRDLHKRKISVGQGVPRQAQGWRQGPEMRLKIPQAYTGVHSAD
jgi:hypothetical protein